MALVNGIGGCFVYSEDPKTLSEWYAKAFQLELESYGPTSYGLTFTALHPLDRTRKLQTVFSIMKAKQPIPRMRPNEDPKDAYGDQPFMLNLRVDDMETTVAHLKACGVEPLGGEDEAFGRFVWVRDPEGNRIELWEPAGSF